ncbi:hypothetical protein [Entomobacter blattae]|uniref:Uncharacterized protein n=1 Tax=Entomobacter blattae TaxID=2762277 RepID=A0A7H1NNN5_9PROT|nr:hypothetical protein [Entomobacter blattae]QNT77395.1 hypothetical protein JGUZn3_01290 [Entomobacter blattae]
MLKDQIPFYAEVIVKENTTRSQHTGKKGAIMAISEEDGHIYGYRVILFDDYEDIAESMLEFDKKSAFFPPHELEVTGVMYKRSDFYDGNYIKVSPEGEWDGKIYQKEEDESDSPKE